MQEWLAGQALHDRIDEEIARASRAGGSLSCLLVAIDNIEEIAAAHGPELARRAVSYAGQALTRDLRRFDRVGRLAEARLLVILPGADANRGEIVARRALARLRAIKIETEAVRHPLRVSVGVAAWHPGKSATDLVEGARAAALREGIGFADALGV